MQGAPVVTFVSPVVTTAGPAGVDFGSAVVCKVTSPTAFHALHGLMLEPAWSDSYAAYVQSISNASIGYVEVFECEDCMGCHLS